ncbi:MAG: beta-N-acetylhexosaminidase [Flavobacteriaceae bacterium]|nr:beta-N-acetylhexosaminidase [Flavobacteriaceae bacterium]|tara:strand:- start:290522 stop:292819 length:2298 start_codon:yes stop_codon:yes gene_type:complete
MKHLFFLAFLLLISCADKEKEIIENELAIIPKPQEITVYKGSFTLNSETTFYAEEEFEIASQFISEYLKKSGFGLKKTTKDQASFIVEKDSLLPKEGYTLSISEKKINITAKDASGAFYAMQTLRQLLPVSLERRNSFPKPSASLPLVEINDFPKFSYRGMHLDVARHFFDKEFVKKYISYLAMLKMNYFHWHLTEDQGWRIEIKKYPKLTTHAAYRNETLMGHYNDTPQQFDGQRYGGFYTQEDIKEIVAYAQKMKVTIIPEIEMPGHAQAAISAYPELGCTGETIPVATKWGVFEDIYCPKEETFAFLEDVLTEVVALFPGEYIHIGGDEAPKAHWKNCKHCQALIKKEGLKDEHELQSYFITRIEKFLNSKGKKIIGWDEILEGGLAPNATVMSWRGTEGGIAAAKQHHNVIMTPGSHCYFDYYQSESEDEPLAIGGFVPLEKVYGFNPIPSALSEEEAKYILGAQGNVWTEYMKTPKHVEYMIFPRILALSEVDWKGPTQDFEKDYPQFVSRVESFMERLDIMGVNFANHLYQLKSKIFKENGKVYYELSTPTQGKKIFYSVNDSKEKKYETPILISENSVIKSYVSQYGNTLGKTLQDSIIFHKAINGTITLNKDPHPKYNSGGKVALINGRLGSNSRYGDSEWLGFWGDDLEVIIDLIEPKEISKVSTQFYHAPGQWIYAPKVATIQIISKGGEMKSETVSVSSNTEKTTTILSFDLSKIQLNEAYKIIIRVPNYGTIPQGQQGAGNKAWTFIDEIVIE